MVKLGNITFIKTGKLNANAEILEGKYPFFTCSKEEKRIDSFAFDGEYIIVAGNGDLNVKYYNGKFNAYQRTYAIEPKKDIDGKYLFFFLESYIDRLRGQSIGGVIKYIKLGNLTEAKIPLPPLKTQQQIAKILDDASHLRNKTQQLINEYDLLAQAIFLETFGDPVINPKGWKIEKLGNIGNWQSGGTPSRKTVKFYTGSIPWLSSGELNQMYISNSKEHITEEALKLSSAKLIPKGSLLLGMYDTAALKSSINSVELTCNQAIAFGVLKSDLVNIVYTYSIIQIGREYYRRQQRGARQKNLNISMVKGIKIMLPPIALQNEFAEKIALIEAQKTLAKQELQEAENLFHCLLQKAFKGKLVV